MRSEPIARIGVALLWAGLTALGAWFVAHGRFNIDEGMHLHAGRLLYGAGALPYRDFPFSQGPGGPLFYGAVEAVFGGALTTGRVASLLANLVAVGCGVWFVSRFSGAAGAAIVLAITAVNLAAVWTFTQIRTEPVSTALVTGAVVAWWHRDGDAWHWALAPSLLVWAASIRLTTGLVLVCACALVAYELRGQPRRLAAVAAIVAANSVAAFWPVLVAPSDAWFHIVTAQLSRADRLGWQDYSAWNRLWSFGQAETRFGAILLLAAYPALLAIRAWREGWRPRAAASDDPVAAVALLFAVAALVYAPQLVFRMGFFQYFVTSALLLTLAIGIAVPLLARRSDRGGRWIYASVAAAWIACAAVGAAHLEHWVYPREPTLGRLAALRGPLARVLGDDCQVLTFETYLAVELGCLVVPGLEYSYFSFFPDLPDEEARTHGVLNRRLLARRLREDPPELIALTAEAVERIRGRPLRRGEKPHLQAMGRRYRPVAVEKLPVGPILVFEVEVHLYAREDLLEPSTASNTIPAITARNPDGSGITCAAPC